MQYIYHYIDHEVWEQLPKEAQSILEHHFYRPTISIKGFKRKNMVTRTISEPNTGIEASEKYIIKIEQ